ncbi:MAG: AraC family transcriptional regulator [Treponema sp.]|nr:AraC family transcriptional regulator [Treponema sp.]
MIRVSWFSKYFWSYLIIGVVPILFGVIFYYTSIPTLEREVERSHFTALDQARREMEYIAGEMKNTALHFSGYLESFPGAPLMKSGEGLSAADKSVLSQRIKTYEETLNFPVNIVLFFRGGTLLYTSQGVVSYRNFEEDIRADGDLTMSSFYTRINSIHTSTSLRFSRFPFTDSGNATGMAYLYPLPYLDVMPRATLCFVFRSTGISNIIENYLGNINADIFLFNEMLAPLYINNELGLPANFYSTLSSLKGVGVQERKINGAIYTVMRSVSENSGITLVSVMKESDFYVRIRPTKYIIFISVGLLELIVLIFAIVMSRRNYEPIRNLLDHIGGSSWKYEKSGQETEFDFIRNKVNTIEETNLELSHALDRQRPMVAYSCLRSLLSGEYNTIDELDYYLKYANIDLSWPWFFVMIITPVGMSSAGTDRETKPGFDEKHIMGSQIQLLLASSAKDLGTSRLYTTELIPEQQVAVIVNAAETRAGDEDIRRYIAQYLVNAIRENYQMEVRVSAGRICDSTVKIQTSFLEARAVMSDYLSSRGNIILFEEMAGDAPGSYRYRVIEQSLYIQSVKQANTETALRAVDLMADKAAEAGAAPVTQCLCFDIINTMMKAAGELKTEIPIKKLKALTGFADLEQFRLMARDLTIDICKQSMEMRKEKDSSLKDKIITHVNEQFCNAQFSLLTAADHFGLGATYLSRFFKQETGYNFVDYVSMLRLDRVKELLVSTDKQIKEIVFDVGYRDTASFVRKFRAKEGITPGQYRERMREHSSAQEG